MLITTTGTDATPDRLGFHTDPTPIVWVHVLYTHFGGKSRFMTYAVATDFPGRIAALEETGDADAWVKARAAEGKTVYAIADGQAFEDWRVGVLHWALAAAREASRAA